MFPEQRTCKCGRSWGQYLPDNSTTAQTEFTLSLGIANQDFSAAVKTFMQNQHHFSPALSLRAWINPNSEPDVTYVEEDPKPGTGDKQETNSNDG